MKVFRTFLSFHQCNHNIRTKVSVDKMNVLKFGRLACWHVKDNGQSRFLLCSVNGRRPFALSTANQYSTESQAAGDEDDNEDLRNVSRLRSELRNRMLHVMDPSTRQLFRERIRHYRKLPFEREDFAKYGIKSGVDPSILWPTRAELDETLALEKQFQPSLQQMWTKIANKRKEEDIARKKKQEHIAKQMARMPQLVEQFRQKLQKKETARADQEKKKEILLEEAREYYGYPISYYDPRIEELKAKKEEEQKKLAKAKRKEEKQAKWLAQLRGEASKMAKAAATSDAAATVTADAKTAVSAPTTPTTDTAVGDTKAAKKSSGKAKKAAKSGAAGGGDTSSTTATAAATTTTPASSTPNVKAPESGTKSKP